MISDYVLKIHCSASSMDRVSEILGVSPTEREHGYWGFEISERETDDPVPFVDVFMRILEGKYDLLNGIGVARADISVWVFGEYSGQCAMQFLAEDLRRLGNEGIDLCVQCWETCDV